MRGILFVGAVLVLSAHPWPAVAQIAPCSGDDTIFTGREGSREEWIQLKVGQACEMAIEIGARQRSIEFVKVFSQGHLGRAATAGRHMVMYRAGSASGKDRFQIGIGIIGPTGVARLFKRTVNVDVTP